MQLVKVNSKCLMNFSVGILQILVKLVQLEILQLITCSATGTGMLMKRALTSNEFTEGARVVIPYIKGLSEQYRHILAKYRVRVFFKGTSTIKSLLMHPKDPIPDAQKTDIIYHWKCPAGNCTAEYIGETNRSLKERVSDHRNQTTSAIRNHHISTKHPKAELKDFTIIDRESNTLHHQAKEALHICIIPPVFNKLLKPSRQLELPHSSIPHPRGAPSSLGLSTEKTINTSHLLDLHLQ